MLIINNLSKGLHKAESEVVHFLSSAPRKYKVFKIPKRTHGFRIIAQPSKELKEYQRMFLKLYTLPIHQVAMAYRAGIGIRENALAHSKNQFLLKIDLENFFNSITPLIFWRAIEKSELPYSWCTSILEKSYVEKLLFWQPVKRSERSLMLSVGAPSSPSISNFCLYEFDRVLFEKCIKNKITYTRYADDLTFSTNEEKVMGFLPSFISELLRELFGGRLKINHGKTVFSSKKHNRHVTGITINNEGCLSLGRERKRYIKHLVNNYRLNIIDVADLNYLRGMLAFSLHVEPDFVERLKEKYTSEVIASIRRAELNDETT